MEHKIQSREIDSLKIELMPVPKLLGHIKNVWNPKTLAVSFKLETDIKILKKKALGAIEKYQMDYVVANELQSRRWKVIIYTKEDEVEITTQDPNELIEVKIIEYLKDKVTAVSK